MSDIVPVNWTVVKVDLWRTFYGKPPRLQALGLSSTGGDALFDQSLLGRTEADLAAVT